MDFEKIETPVNPDILEDGDYLLDGEQLFEYKKLPTTSERDFEDDVELFLERTGWKTFRKQRVTGGGFAVGQLDYDRELALKVDSLVDFVKETQPAEWAKIEKLYGANAKAKFLKRVCDKLEPHRDADGLINCLRRPIDMAPGASFRLCYFQPVSSKNPDLMAKYAANRFEVVRQLRYGTMADDANDSIDVVLFLNGIPVVTMELKNNLSGQHTAHAVRQYKRDRNPKEIIFKPNRRSIVHFALDGETVEMTTWLRGDKTLFLPFNQGNGMNGAGNPANPGGYRTEYLYRRVLAPDSLMDILQRFVSVEYDAQTKAMKAIIFPRFHQLDAVRALAADAKQSGPGKNYLIQHSAGSGKSYSIAWLAHRLSSLHAADNSSVFDSVIVLTDRRNLDSQLSADVEGVEHRAGVVVRIDDDSRSGGLRDAINGGAKIITSTIQKFPYICGETKAAGKRFAVIIDEAHSSQAGRTHAKMKMALADVEPDEVEAEDAQDRLVAEMQAQGALPNLSIFAFTATPKAVTLEVFGTRDEQCATDKNGNVLPRPFHLYSMKQAIQEGFILDVLENYTCYDTYFKLAKTIVDDPKLKEAKANKALMHVVTADERVLSRRAAIIVEHFVANVAGVLDCKAKAMVVASSRASALAYYRAIAAYAKEQGYNVPALVAFSGTLPEGGRDVTEAAANGFPESQTAERFDTDEYRIMVCADKFQTGFDQPKLCAMYVDKVLTGVAAVQTLSRLNRCRPGKRTFVLDFVNDWETIQASFAPYYEVAEIDRATDPDIIYDTRQKLETYGVLVSSEVDAVCKLWFQSEGSESALARIEGMLSPAVDRWNALEDEDKKLFKALLKKFLRSYSFVTQMISLGDADLHRLFTYGGLLIKKLFIEVSSDISLRDKVELEYLRIEDKGTRAISLEAEKLHNGAAIPGVKPSEDEEYLSVLVKQMNERFGTDWKDADKLIRACADKIMEDTDFVAKARGNSMSEVASIFMDVMMDALYAILDQGGEMAEAFSKDSEGYSAFLSENLLPVVYRRANE